MHGKIHNLIADAARAQYGWKPEDVRVDGVERLRRPSCSFYTVMHDRWMLSYMANYVLLDGKQVLGSGDSNVVAKILDTCSADAPAAWWAEIVARFHRDINGGIVLTNEKRRPDVVRRLLRAGETFSPPALDHEKLNLVFLLLNSETDAVYRIQATRKPGGPVEVVGRQVLGPPSVALHPSAKLSTTKAQRLH